MKGFLKATSTYVNGFPKAAGMSFFKTVCRGFQNPFKLIGIELESTNGFL
jgi:hypothetical protein